MSEVHSICVKRLACAEYRSCVHVLRARTACGGTARGGAARGGTARDRQKNEISATTPEHPRTSPNDALSRADVKRRDSRVVLSSSCRTILNGLILD